MDGESHRIIPALGRRSGVKLATTSKPVATMNSSGAVTAAFSSTDNAHRTSLPMDMTINTEAETACPPAEGDSPGVD